MTSPLPFDDDDVEPVPGAETRMPEFGEADPGPFGQFHQPTPPSPIVRRIGAGPFKVLIGGLGLVAIVILLAETF